MVCLPLEPSSPVPLPLPIRQDRHGRSSCHGVGPQDRVPERCVAGARNAQALRHRERAGHWSDCAGRCVASATRAGGAAMRARRARSISGCDRHERGVANRRSEGIVVKRASRAGQPILDRIGTARCAAAAQAMRRHRRARQRAVPMRQATCRVRRAGRCVASATCAGVAAMRARRRGRSMGAIGTARCAAAVQAMRRHRRARQRAVLMPQA